MARSLNLRSATCLGSPYFSGALPKGGLHFDERGMTLRVVWKDTLHYPWETITDVQIEGPDTVQRRFTATRLAVLGPLALAIPKRQKVAFVVVTRGDGDTFFQIRDFTEIELRGALQPWLLNHWRRPAPAPEVHAERRPVKAAAVSRSVSQPPPMRRPPAMAGVAPRKRKARRRIPLEG